MFRSLALCLAVVVGGTISTYVYEDDAPVAWRVAAGAVPGMALMGLFKGLNGPTIAVAACLANLPLLLLTRQRIRAQVRHEARRSRELIRAAAFRHVITWLVVVGALVLVTARALDRVILESPPGLSTGYANNFGDLPFHTGVIARFAFGDNFPPEHPSYAGTAFAYPYLADLVAAAFVRCGSTLRQAMLLQNAVLLGSLLVLLAAWFRQLTPDRAAALLACVLTLLSGSFASTVEASADIRVGRAQGPAPLRGR